jgi:ELWxxDGT repeat protein
MAHSRPANREQWKTDGTDAGTVLSADRVPGATRLVKVVPGPGGPTPGNRVV